MVIFTFQFNENREMIFDRNPEYFKESFVISHLGERFLKINCPILNEVLRLFSQLGLGLLKHVRHITRNVIFIKTPKPEVRARIGRPRISFLTIDM